jgi:hypothetical protein
LLGKLPSPLQINDHHLSLARLIPENFSVISIRDFDDLLINTSRNVAIR